MSNTIEMIKEYKPFNQQEEKDKQFFIDCEKQEQILTRYCAPTIKFIIRGLGLVDMLTAMMTCYMLQKRK